MQIENLSRPRKRTQEGCQNNKVKFLPNFLKISSYCILRSIRDLYAAWLK